MKKALFIILFSLINYSIYSQCTTGASTGSLIVSSSFQTIPNVTGTPSYRTFNTIAGQLYTFTYCQGGGSYTGDPYLTIADNAGNPQTWNDDFCGLGTELNWIAPSSGTYRIYTSGCCPCSNAPAATLAYRFLCVNTVTCPANINVNNTAGTCGRAVTYTSSSTGAGTITYTFTGATTASGSGDGSGSTFNVGVTNVTITSTNGCGTVSCSFTVTVVDNQAPTITCPSNISVIAPAGQCGTRVCYASPTGTDNCPPAQPAGFGPLTFYNGNYYALSTTQDTYANAKVACRAAGGHLATVSNGAENALITSLLGGNNAWIGFTDELIEGTFVWENCQPVTYANWNAGEPNNSGGIEHYTEIYPTGLWNDLPGIATSFYLLEIEAVRITQIAGLAQNAVFPVGVTTNTFLVVDAAGNSNTCSFTVTVVDNQAPTMGNLISRVAIIGNNSNANIQTYLTSLGFTATDFGNVIPAAATLANFDAVILLRINGDPTLASWVTGGGVLITEWSASSWATNTANLLTATDLGGAFIATGTQVTFAATPLGTQLSTSLSNPYSDGTATEFFRNFTSIGSGVQIVGTRPAGVPAILAGPSGSGYCFLIGYDWADGFPSGASNSGTLIRNILNSNVLSTCPSNIVLCGSQAVTFATPTASDNCSVVVTQTTGLASGSIFPVGTTINTFVATDPSGNTATCSFTVTINPIPTVNAVTNQVFCNGSPTTAVTFTGAVSGTIYNWTNTQSSIGLASTGSGNIASFTATNTGTAPVVATIQVTPSYTNAGVTCTGTPINYTYTVNPTPTAVATPSSQTRCSGIAIATIVITGNPVAGVVYNWSRDNGTLVGGPVSGIAASGSGNISGTLTNTTNTPITVTFTITPTANGCPGTPVTATVLVNPTPTVNAVANQVLCNGAATTAVTFTGTVSSPPGTVYNWTNTQSSIGLASTGSGNIASFTATNTGTAPVVATIQVTPSYTNAGVTCSGTPTSFTITVNPTAIVIVPANAGVCNAVVEPAGTFNFSTTATGGVTTYTWINSNTSIGLASNGAGNTLPTFTPTNAGTSPISGTITVTPTFTNGGVSCVGTPSSFTITVNPTAQVVQPTSQVLCNQASTTAITFTTINTGGVTTYAWTNNTTSIGLAASGNGNIPSFVAVNLGTAPVVATIIVTPTFTNAGRSCTGPTKTFTITVNPTGQVNQPANQVVCNATSTATVTFTTVNTGGVTTYAWTNDLTSIGLAASGNGNILSFIAINTGTVPVVATIIVTPTFTNAGVSCPGPTKTFTITVNPTGQVNQPLSQVVCNGANTNGIIFTTINSGPPSSPGLGVTTYTWTNSAPSIGLAASGNGDIPTFVAINTGTAPVVATIVVIPTFTYLGVSCTGPSKTFTITVNPTPNAVATPAAQTICSGSAITNIVLSGSVPGTVFSWTRNNTSAVTGIAANGTGTPISGSLTNTTNAPITVTFTIIPTYTNAGVTCTGTTITATVLVNPTAVVNPVASQVICTGANTLAVSFSSPTTGGTIVYNWTNTNSSIGLAASGTGNIASFTGLNTTNAPNVGTITVTPTFTNGGISCVGTPTSFTITVNPNPVVNTVANQVVCNGGATAAVNFSSPTTGGTIVYNWTNNTTSIGLAGTGMGNIPSFFATNATNAPVTATVTVIPTYTNAGVSCIGTAMMFTITVNPTATINPVANQVVCNGSPTAAIVFSSPTTGGTIVYNWTNTLSSIGLGPNGIGNIPSFIATNPGTVPLTATVSVLPTYTNGGISCVGTPINFTITVNPTPTVTQPANQVLCHGATTAPVNFTGTVVGTVYNWTNNNTSIGLAASGTGNIPAFTATNAGTTVQTATIQVTPSYTNAGVTCTGTASTFTITVNPIPTVNAQANQTVCAGTFTTVNFTGAVANTVYNWTNSNTSIGLGASGSGNIGFTATNSTAAPITGTITVTPTFTNGGVTCTGTSTSFTITVNPMPTVNTVANQVLCNGSATAAINFTGTATGTVYNWTNNNTTIGLAASGTGNIASFTAVNTGITPVTATIVVTPVFTAGGVTCTGSTMSFTITVNPTPTVNAIANQILCNGASTTAVTITGPVAGTVYNWTNNNTFIGLASNGTGVIPAFNAINTGSTPVVATITVTPTYTNAGVSCTGASISFTITVNPTANVNPIASQVRCNATLTAAVTFTGAVAGTVYNWTNSNTTIGLAASGTGNIPAFTAINTGTVPVTATITVTPSATGCAGSPISFTITVNPTPTVNAIANQTVCAGSSSTAVTLSGSVPGTVYSWTNNNTTIGLAASGVGVVPSFVTINPTTSAITATITVTTAYTNGALTCTGATTSFTITVNPLPNITFTNVPPRVCLTDTIVRLAASPIGGTWSGAGVSGNNFNARTAGIGVHAIRYTITNSNGCTSSEYVNVIVNDCVERHNIFAHAIKIGPNPSNGIFNVYYKSDVYTEMNIRVVTAMGQIVQDKQHKGLIFGTTIPMNLSRLASGTYYLQVYNTKEQASFKFIIAR